MPVHPDSALLVTLDSCRFDTFESAACPNIKGVGPWFRAHAPGAFTYASHAAMFVGFTPGDASSAEPYRNPKFAKVFQIEAPGRSHNRPPRFALTGRNIVDGFNRAGHATVGAAAMAWFNPETAAGRTLTEDFQRFRYTGTDAEAQVEFALESIRGVEDRPVFAFVNIGETHVPYWHKGATWEKTNPCVPFGSANDAAECRRRQRACLEFVDGAIAPLLRAFEGATALVCGDHGDCWGEDGLWEHGVHHPKVLEVPMVMRIVPPAQRGEGAAA